jgi:hypothetical protein
MYLSERRCMRQVIGLLKGAANIRVSLTNFWVMPMHYGVERRIALRHQRVGLGIISLAPTNRFWCVVCDISPGGFGLVLPRRVSILGAEFDLTFDETTFRCVAVWRRLNRIGVKVKSTMPPS